MANSDKNIVIIPNRNDASQPNIRLTGNANVPMTARVVENNSLSFENFSGQMFSIANNVTTGSIFSVNDISGIPSINVDASGNISLAHFGGNVGVGNSNPTSRLHVFGNIRISNTAVISGIQFADNTYQTTASGWTPAGPGNSIVYAGNTAIGSVPLANNGLLQVFGHSAMGPIFERTQYNAGAPAANINIDAMNNTLVYFAGAATGNVNVNIRGNTVTAFNLAVQTGQASTMALAVTNGATAFFPRAFTIDSLPVTPRWAGGSTIVGGNNNSVDFYNIAVFKNANNAYNVFVTQSRFA
jgi:hypothetical protein